MLVTNQTTQTVYAQAQSYIELASGLNVPQLDGSFEPANPAFALTPEGAEAMAALHKVKLAGNINAPGAAAITTPDGVVLRSNPLGFGYYDPVSGESVLLGEVTDAIGWLIASNEVVFSNCFAGGIRASIHLRNSVGGFSQSLVLHERVPPPSDFNLSARARLELFTEFSPETAEPLTAERALRSETDPQVRAAMIEPDLTDTTLTFGQMRIAQGRAFAVQGAATRPVGDIRAPVAKSFTIIDGRRVLIESVEHAAVRELIENLPPPRTFSVTNASLSPRRSLPMPRMAQLMKPKIRAAETAAITRESSREYAFVADYEILNGT